jgi:hypothetical protein
MKKIGLVSILMLLTPFVAVVGLFCYFFFYAPAFPGATGVEHRGQFGDSFGVLTSLFSGLGIAGVVGTIWMQQLQIREQASQRKEEVDESRSLFQLETSARAYREAWELLKDHNNDRTTWMRAGRLLGHARLSGTHVTLAEHQVSLEITRLEYRSLFSDLIKQKGADFFYGGETGIAIDAAAVASTTPRDQNGNRFTWPYRYLDTASLFAVWDASRWPKEYDDPLERTFDEDERAFVKFGSRGLDEYLKHRDLYNSEGGALIPKGQKTNSAWEAAAKSDEGIG